MHARAHTFCVTTARRRWPPGPGAWPLTSPRTQVWGDAGAEAALGLGHWSPLTPPGPEAGNTGRRPRGRVAVHARASVLSTHLCSRPSEEGGEHPLLSLQEPLRGRVTLIQPAASSFGGTATKPTTLSCQLLTRSGAPQSPVRRDPDCPQAWSGCRKGCHEDQAKAFPKPRTRRVCPSNTSQTREPEHTTSGEGMPVTLEADQTAPFLPFPPLGSALHRPHARSSPLLPPGKSHVA